MIVCICHRVRSAEILERLEQEQSVEDISRELGLGTGCGRCLEHALDMEARHQNVIASA